YTVWPVKYSQAVKERHTGTTTKKPQKDTPWSLLPRPDPPGALLGRPSQLPRSGLLYARPGRLLRIATRIFDRSGKTGHNSSPAARRWHGHRRIHYATASTSPQRGPVPCGPYPNWAEHTRCDAPTDPGRPAHRLRARAVPPHPAS